MGDSDKLDIERETAGCGHLMCDQDVCSHWSLDDPEALDALRTAARRQSAAHHRMLEIGQGVGGLGVQHPEMVDHMIEWDHLSADGHADTVLALLAEVERLRGGLAALTDAIQQIAWILDPEAGMTEAALTMVRLDREDLDELRRLIDMAAAVGSGAVERPTPDDTKERSNG